MTDISPLILQKYFEMDKLGTLVVPIHPERKISLDLKEFYKHSTGLQFLEYETSPKNIETIVIYGSVLWKHFPVPDKTILKRTGFLGLGKKVPKKIPGKMEIPKDFDVMVVTKNSMTDKIIAPTIEIIDYGWGYESYGVKSGIHITYRSEEQIQNECGKEGTISESVIRYGVPIFGQNRFNEIASKIKIPERNPLHRVEWSEDSKERLQGQIL